MVWYGMVWYGMVWYGMVLYCMVFYGIVWYGIVWFGISISISISLLVSENILTICKIPDYCFCIKQHIFEFLEYSTSHSSYD